MLLKHIKRLNPIKYNKYKLNIEYNIKRHFIATGVDANEAEKQKIQIPKLHSNTFLKFKFSQYQNWPIDEERIKKAGETEIFKKLAESLKNGIISQKYLIEGIKKGVILPKDLDILEENGALNKFTKAHVATAAVGGSQKLSFGEIMGLIKEKYMDNGDIIGLINKGELVKSDVEYLNEINLISDDSMSKIEQGVKIEDNREMIGYKGVVQRLKSKDMKIAELEAMVISGMFHGNDLDLLVQEGLLKKEQSEKILDNSSVIIVDAYSKAETLAALVRNKKLMYEELEVMRTKGVLGNGLIHYLVMSDAIEAKKGEKLLKMSELLDYVDSNSEDEEGMRGGGDMRRQKMTYEKQDVKYDDKSFYDDPAWTEEEKEILKRGGKSDGGFFPENIPKNDIFALWEYLTAYYSPGSSEDRSFEEYLQEAAAEVTEEKYFKQVIEKKKQSEIKYIQVIDSTGRAYAVGKRKTAIAQAWIKEGTGYIEINRKTLYDYFLTLDYRCYILAPFVATDKLGKFDAKISVIGGGPSGQAQAIRHALARALQFYDPLLRKVLKPTGMLSRDNRIVERKKPGRAKARKAFQWVKR